MFVSLARLILIVSIFACCTFSAASDSKQLQKPPISKESRLQIIRLLNAEYVWVRKPFPAGEKGLTINPQGEVTPGDAELRQLVATRGPVARPGDRAQITSVEFKGSGIRLEINGGPKKKTKWYQRIQVGGSGGMTPVAPGPDQAAKGSYLFLDFKDYVPEISLAEIREILKPVFDFSVKSAAQAYTDTLPENVRNAIRDHKVLVGMNKEMVTYAKGRPPQRIREKDNGKEYEEWIFGTPPEDVDFVRFNGEEVVQVKTMKVDGEKIVRTQKEVQLEDPSQAHAQPVEKPEQKPKPAGAPTLRRPGEAAPQDDPLGDPSGRGPVVMPPPQSPPPGNNPTGPGF